MSKLDPAAEKRFYSIRQASFYSGLSPSLLYQKIKEKALRCYRVNTKIIIEKEDLDKMIFQGAQKSDKQLRKMIHRSKK